MEPLGLTLAGETWVLTGAGGRIATRLRAGLAAAVGRLRLVDEHAVAAEHPGEECALADLRDQAAVERSIVGAHGVIHLGAIAGEAGFHELAAVNVLGTFHVLEAARRAGARRVLIASSNHVTGLYPSDVVVDPQMPLRPDSLYGVSKATGEALGRLYAEKFGLEVACLRIGSFAEEPSEPRMLRTWLSPDDALAAILALMATPALTFAAPYLVSRNTQGFWDLSAGEALGVDPRDDAERFAAALGPASPPDEPQGGAFASPQATLEHLADRSRG